MVTIGILGSNPQIESALRAGGAVVEPWAIGAPSGHLAAIVCCDADRAHEATRWCAGYGLSGWKLYPPHNPLACHVLAPEQDARGLARQVIGAP